MPDMLCIDTASAVCGVSLQSGGEVHIRQASLESQAAASILLLIDELLGESGLTLAGLDGIGVMTGPGSFTGIRIGLAVAQGLAYPHDLPLMPLSSLAVQAGQALASAEGSLLNADGSASADGSLLSADGSVASTEGSASAGEGSERWVLVCQQARPGEVYAGAYLADIKEAALEKDRDSAPSAAWGNLLGREQVCRLDKSDADSLARLPALFPTLPKTSPLLCSDCPELAEALCARLGLQSAALMPFSSEPIVPLSSLAAMALQRGLGCSAAELRPNYVKDQLDYNRTVQAHDS